MSEIAQKTCTPCRGGVPPMTAEESAEMLRQTPDWELFDDGKRIQRSIKFKDFAAAFAFVRLVSDLAESEGHHPDISFGWGYVTVSLQTHKIHGLHENDFIIAAKINRLGGMGAEDP